MTPPGDANVTLATAVETRSTLCADLDAAVDAPLDTPRSVVLRRTAEDHWARAARGIRAAGTSTVRAHAAYSVKTNPHSDLLDLAQSSGMLVEAISQLEVRKALQSGFSPGSVVLNGPGKWWPGRVACGPLRAVFCDSLVEMEEVSRWVSDGADLAEVVGVRLRPPGVPSRFGIPVSSRHELEAVATAVRGLPRGVAFGVHFHLPSWVASPRRRWSLIAEMVQLAGALDRSSGRSVRTLDIGGGWRPESFVGQLLPALAELGRRARSQLPDLSDVIVEPGRALAEPTMAMLTRVLEVRPTGDGDSDVVVDACVADVPEIALHPHRIWARDRNGEWRRLLPGTGAILGRSCMEADVLAAGIDVGAALGPGDCLAVLDVGAYDASKSYVFGCG